MCGHYLSIIQYSTCELKTVAPSLVNAWLTIRLEPSHEAFDRISLFFADALKIRIMPLQISIKMSKNKTPDCFYHYCLNMFLLIVIHVVELAGIFLELIGACLSLLPCVAIGRYVYTRMSLLLSEDREGSA